MDITLPHNWAPRAKQQNLWNYLLDGGTRASVCWHRRFGKDDVCLHWSCIASHTRIGSYWHMLPEKEQARKAIWTQINPHTGIKRIDEAFPLALRKRTSDQEMFIEFQNGSTWQIAGSDNYNSLVGSSPCGIVFSEYALANPASWAYLRPILRENGGWAVFISTPRGKNHFFNLHQFAKEAPGWFAETLTVADTQVLSEKDLQADLAELQAEHGDAYGKAIWLQENYCSFDAAIPGSYWAESLDAAQLAGRICSFPLDPHVPVDTGWDLGRTDDTAIWFRQLNGTQIDVIDHHSSNGKDVEFYWQLLLAKKKEHGITYGTHYLPHDARPRTLAAGGKSILQQFHDAAKLHPELGRFSIIPRLDVQEGIQAARKTFPRCRFHETRCAEGLNSLRHYHREWDAELKKYLDHPVHDWSSHDADAWRTLSLSWKVKHPQQPDSPLVDKLLAGDESKQTWGAMRAAHFSKRQRARAWANS